MQRQPSTTSSRAYYSESLSSFCLSEGNSILGVLTRASEFDVTATQRDAWISEITVLQAALRGYAEGAVFLEFVVPRLGKRIDAVVVLRHLILVIEFKVGEKTFTRSARDQVWDYALDLKNFHETSHAAQIVPILIVTDAPAAPYKARAKQFHDGVYFPEEISPGTLPDLIEHFLAVSSGSNLASEAWQHGAYRPTPTIIEAARALFARHSIADLAKTDATAKNLASTTGSLTGIVGDARKRGRKAICLVTGVPGAGKTLVGLDVATRHMDPKSALHSVYLSGNGPLVKILREALARDRVEQARTVGRTLRKGDARREVDAFIQNIHHFRDECLKDLSAPPPEHVAIFDEAQRAWNVKQTSDFMARKKGRPDFRMSEPEFLISCLDRHPDWAVVICLIGGGQEINTGEAGIVEWLEALERSFPSWDVHVSARLHDSEYRAGHALANLQRRQIAFLNDDLHLSVSMRSFRAENLSSFVKSLLELDATAASREFQGLAGRYPIRLTRSVSTAKKWLRAQARGSERYGIVVSSQAQRLKPLAIDVRVPTDPVHWFLDGPDDVRSSFYLEDAATEFDVQGLELDWTCVVWDGDLRFDGNCWQHFSFVGTRWNRVRMPDRRMYLENAYRVLLTRARQGMVIVVPEGARDDATRAPDFYDGTYAFLESVGLPTIDPINI